jgi:urea-proton symporter
MVFYCRENCKNRPDCFLCSLCLDRGCNTTSILNSCLSVWHKWTILVYAAGASIQVILFAILAMELKHKSPSSHTFPEMIYTRFGKRSHKVFLFFALMTNTIVTAMLVLGGAAVLNSLTGVNTYVAAFLIPVGVIIFTFFGGLIATFLAEYLNTVFLFTVVLVFVIAMYFANPQIGGVSGMFDKLTDVAVTKPVEGNFAGSYLTMASTGALVFGIINIVGNFGTVSATRLTGKGQLRQRPSPHLRVSCSADSHGLQSHSHLLQPLGLLRWQ